MQKASQESAAAIIRKAGFRATKSRLLIYAFLRNAKFPVSVQEVLEGVGKNNIDHVTAYRVLSAFQKAGIAARIDLRHGRAYFELKDEKAGHHHIICTGCKRIEDVMGRDFERLAHKALRRTKRFAEITSHSLEFFGLCNSCVTRGKTMQTA